MATGMAGSPSAEPGAPSLGAPAQNRVSWSAARAMGQNNLAARPESDMPETESARLLARFKQTALLKQKADALVNELGDVSGETLEQRSVRAFRSLAALQEKVNAKEREEQALLHQEMRAAGVYTAMRMEYDQLLKMKQADAAGHQSALLQLRKDMAAQRQLIASLQQRLQASESLIIPVREAPTAAAPRAPISDIGGIVELVSRTRRQEVEIARLQRQVAAFHDMVGLSGDISAPSSASFGGHASACPDDASLAMDGVNSLANSAMVLRVRLHASQEALEDKDRQVKELAEELGAARATATELESRVARLVAERADANATLSRLQAQWQADHERVRKVLQDQISTLEGQVAVAAASEQRARRSAAKEREMAKLQGAVATCISKELGETQRLLMQGGGRTPGGTNSGTGFTGRAAAGATNGSSGTGADSPSRRSDYGGFPGGEFGGELLGGDAGFTADGNDGFSAVGGRGSVSAGELDALRSRLRAAEARVKEAEVAMAVSRERSATVLAELHKDLAQRDGRVAELQKALQKALADKERETEASVSSKGALREVDALRREVDGLNKEIKGKDERIAEMQGLKSILRIKDAQLKELEVVKGQMREAEAAKGRAESLRATVDTLRAENEVLRAQLRGGTGGGLARSQSEAAAMGQAGAGGLGVQAGAERERERAAGGASGRDAASGSRIPLPDASTRGSSRETAAAKLDASHHLREMEEDLAKLREASFEKDAELRLAHEALAAEKARTSHLGAQVEAAESKARELEASVRQLTQAAKDVEAELVSLRDVKDRAWLLEEEVKALEEARGGGKRADTGHDVASLDRLRREHEALKSEHDGLKRVVEELKGERERLAAHVEELGHRAEQAEQQAEASEQALAVASNELERARAEQAQERAELTRQLAEQSRQVAELKGRAATATAEAASKQRELRMMPGNKGECSGDGDLGRLSEDGDKVDADAQARVEELSTEVERLTALACALEAENGQLRDDAAVMEMAQHDLLHRLEAAERQMGDADAAVLSSEARLEACASELGRLTTLIQAKLEGRQLDPSLLVHSEVAVVGDFLNSPTVKKGRAGVWGPDKVPQGRRPSQLGMVAGQPPASPHTPSSWLSRGIMGSGDGEEGANDDSGLLVNAGEGAVGDRPAEGDLGDVFNYNHSIRVSGANNSYDALGRMSHQVESLRETLMQHFADNVSDCQMQ